MANAFDIEICANVQFRRIGPLARRLEEYTHLSHAACEALSELDRLPLRTFRAREDLFRQGDSPRHIYLIRKGWACRYKLLPDGRRQIIDFPIAGDLCDLNVFILKQLDHSIGAITELDVVEIGRQDFEAIAQPELLRALRWQELVSASYSREWIVNVGARAAVQRIAHLLCEMFLRLESVGETDGLSCSFPPTQQDIGDATGLTSVHVNRSLQELRRAGLIELANRTLTILDLARLKKTGQFNPNYLHLQRLAPNPAGKRF
jgi:CRP-like cAMP-binding protein